MKESLIATPSPSLIDSIDRILIEDELIISSVSKMPALKSIELKDMINISESSRDTFEMSLYFSFERIILFTKERSILFCFLACVSGYDFLYTYS